MAAEGRAGQEILTLRRTFGDLDRDGDGVIPFGDVRVVLSERPETAGQLSPTQRQVLLQKADETDDGAFDFRSFALSATSSEAQENTMRRTMYKAADLVIPVAHRPLVHSYLSAYGCIPPPIFLISLTLAQIGLFLYYTLFHGIRPGWFRGCGGCYVNGQLGPLPFHPAYRWQAWRFLSYMFVHAGIEHLAGNVLIQLVLGLPLELVHKFWRIVPLYCAGVVLGSLLQYSLDSSVMLVGASGGVYALIAAHGADVVLNWSEMPFRWIRLILLFVFVGLDVGHVVYRRVGLQICDRVSYTAHIGGVAAGLLLGLIFLRNIRVLKWERALAWIALVLFMLLLIACIVLTVLVQPFQKPLFLLKCNATNM